MKKSIWLGLAKYAVGLALLACVVYSNWDRPPGAGLKVALSRPVQWLPLIAAGVLFATAALLTFYRWWILVRALGMEFRLGNAPRLGLVGFFFNTLLPGGVGGDIVKAVGIAREQTRRALAVSTVLFDRAVGLWALVWLVALSGGVYWLFSDSDNHLLTTNFGVAAIVRSCWLITVGTIVAWWALGLVSEPRGSPIRGPIGNDSQGRTVFERVLAGDVAVSTASVGGDRYAFDVDRRACPECFGVLFRGPSVRSAGGCGQPAQSGQQLFGRPSRNGRASVLSDAGGCRWQ